MGPKMLLGQGRQMSASLGEEAFFLGELLDFKQLFRGVERRPLVSELRIIIGLRSAHPTGTMNLAFGQSSGGTVCPSKKFLFSPKLEEDFFLAVDHALALLAIITAVSIQLGSLLGSSGRLQESPRKPTLLQAAYQPRRQTIVNHNFNSFIIRYCIAVGDFEQAFLNRVSLGSFSFAVVSVLFVVKLFPE